MASTEVNVLLDLLQTERAHVKREKQERKKMAEWLVETLIENSALRAANAELLAERKARSDV